MHLISTLLHELGHALVDENENGGHTNNWYMITARLMSLTSHISNLKINDHHIYKMCARQCGVNMI